MARKLSREQVISLAKLAKLKLTDEEIEKYQFELSDILGYVEQLSDVDTTGLKETSQVTGLKNVVRSDKEKDLQAKPEDLINAAPRSKDGYIQVGKMI